MTSKPAPGRRARRPPGARNRALYPFARRTPVLVVSGLGDSGAGHWQTLWQARHPEMSRVVQHDFAMPDLERWSGNVARAIAMAPDPPIIVAHSFGCLATVRAVRDLGLEVAGALLVAPADPGKFDLGCEAFSRPLQFPSTLVASTNDPWLKFVTAGALAAQWGSHLVSAGPAGHINADSGHGHWVAGLGLLRDLAERAAAAGTLRDAGPRRGAPTQPVHPNQS